MSGNPSRPIAFGPERRKSSRRAAHRFGLMVLTILLLSAAAFAADLATEEPQYEPTESAVINGYNFQPGETVTLQVYELDGTALSGPGGLPWDVSASGTGDFQAFWLVEWDYAGQVLMVEATGSASRALASTTFLAPQTSLNQLKNGTSTTSPEWANGNINGNSSCYSEGRAVPYRYFIDGFDGGTAHYFTIEMEWTKAGVHALDYLTDYDLTEGIPLAAVGGPCGTISTTPPSDCAFPTESFPFPDFLNTANYSGTIPPDFFTTVNPGFSLDGPRNLLAYNCNIDSLGLYFFGGTSSDRTLGFKVYFTVTDTGSVGFFWGGHLAEGTEWGAGNGSASVSGAPYHMRAGAVDGGGGAYSDRSIQNGVICLPPDVGIVTDSATACNFTNYTYVARDTSSTANTWMWTVINGTIVGSSTADTVVFNPNAGLTDGDTIYVIVEACDSTSGCPGEFCCATDSIAIPVINCNEPPTVSCAADTSVFLCDLTEVCIPGFVCDDPNGNLVSCSVSLGTLSGDTVCFTPTAAGTYTIVLTAVDEFGDSAVCSTSVNVSVNTPPVATCAGNDSLFVCDLSDICLTGFTGSDVDGNLASVTVTGGTLSGDTVCFTPVVGDNVITLIAIDDCGDADTCTTTINVALNSPPVSTCPNDTSFLVNDLSPICLTGFGCSDPDGNTIAPTVIGGTLSGDTVCFTPVIGLNTITLICQDECGAADTCTTFIQIGQNQPPTCNLPPVDTTIFACTPAQICLPVSASDSDNNLLGCQIVSGPGTLAGGQWCYTPSGTEDISVTIRCTDSLGLFCEGTFTVHYTVNSAPTVACAADQSMFVCDLSDICIDGFTYNDVDGNIETVTVTGGTLAGSQVCFTPVAGDNTIILTVTDSCGATASCTTTVSVTLNSPPVTSCPTGGSLTTCVDAGDLCIPGFTCTDPDNNLMSTTVIGGTLSGDTVCFTPVMGNNTITIICVDSCGAADTCTTIFDVHIGNPPVITCPSTGVDTTLCGTNQLCIPLPISDANTVSSTAGGTWSNGQLCYTLAGTSSFVDTIIATNGCGSDTCTISVNAVVNSAPTVSCPGDQSLFVCDLSQICIDGFGYNDVDGNITDVTVTGGTLTGSQVCFTPVVGVNTIILTVTDVCGATASCTTNVTVTLNTPPVVGCPGDDTLFVCDLSNICIDGFTCSDVDNNVFSSVAIGGTLNGSEVCFTPVVGNNTITYICTDSCGAADTCTTNIYVSLNNPPTASCPTVPDQFVCDLQSQLCIDGFTCSDPDNNIAGSTAIGGTLNGSEICLVPQAGANTITYICYDSCGAADTCSVTFNVTVNSPPTVTCPAAIDTFVCDLSQLCVSGFQCSDPDGNVVSTTINGQPYTPGQPFCFTPVAGANTLTMICVDACGLADTCVTTVNVSLNSPPVTVCPPTDSFFVCDLSQICVDGFSASDPDGNLAGTSVVGGTISGSQVCITPVAGNNVITYIATDACGAADTCQTTIHVTVNRPPVASCPGNDTLEVCDLSEICVSGFAVTDADGNIASITVSKGTLNGNRVCFNPAPQNNIIRYIAVDSCGAADTCETNIFVIVNRPPQVSCPVVDTIITCDFTQQICVNGFSSTDLDNNITDCTVNGQPYNDLVGYCFTPVEGDNLLIYECTDACGASTACTTVVTVLSDEPRICLGCPNIRIEKVHEVIQGTYQDVLITIENSGLQAGAFDFLVDYDASALSFISASMGDYPLDCQWEYFQYRYGASGNCGNDPCPSGKLRVVAIADINNGPAHPSCFKPITGDGVIFSLKFLVTNDRTLECTYVPIRFIWYDCGDNTMSSPSGDSLYISNEVFDYYDNDVYVAITDQLAQFPTHFGANSSCDIAIEDGKPDPFRCMDFYNGGIDIACAESLDARGDVNLNEIANEVADVVLFSRYFVYGLGVFTINLQGQIAATDVNADGLALSVADLVYQVRIVTGDADPFPKLAPVETLYGNRGGKVWVESPIAAAYMVVAGDITPTLKADKMDMLYGFDVENNSTRILIFGMDQGDQFAGEFVDIHEGELLSIEMAAYDGSPVTAKLVPSNYALNQNYPNPFNPTTVISFALPVRSDYTLTIYNVVGQVVKTFSGSSDAGQVELEWDATSTASGVYFYRLQAGSFTDTKKMVLLK